MSHLILKKVGDKFKIYNKKTHKSEGKEMSDKDEAEKKTKEKDEVEDKMGKGGGSMKDTKDKFADKNDGVDKTQGNMQCKNCGNSVCTCKKMGKGAGDGNNMTYSHISGGEEKERSNRKKSIAMSLRKK